MIKVFEQFDKLLLEVSGSDDNTKLNQRYGILTGNKMIEEENSFIDKKNRNWQNKYHVYFNAPAHTVKSLRKLGINVMDNKMPTSVLQGKYDVDSIEVLPYVFSNVYWFWKLVEYGYRLGLNDSISFEMFELKKYLKNLKIKDVFPIKKVETESPIVEAKLLAA